MKLTLKEKASFGIGAVGKDMVYAFISSFLLYYYNEVLEISATFIGILFMFARIFDALNDPFMGIVLEKTHTRFGKYRPWIFSGTVLNAIIIYAIFAVPKSISGTNLLIYTSIAYVLWGMTYTIMDIPYWSMIPAITNSGKDRENISVIGRSCAGVGFGLTSAVTLYLVGKLGGGNSRKGFYILACIIAILFVLSLSITVLNVKEKIDEKKETVSIKKMVKALLTNDQAIVVVVGIVVFNASLYLTQQLAIYFFKYDVGNKSLFGLFCTVGGVVQVFAIILLPLIRKKMECKKILLYSLLTAMLGYTILFILGTIGIKNIIILCIPAIFIFLGFGLATVLTTIFLADTVDYGEWKNNQRNEGVIFSLQTFVVKFASAISVLIAGIGLDIIKLNKNQSVQEASTLFNLRVLMVGVPVLGLAFSIIFLMKKYKLTEEFMKNISKELEERRKK